jgi:hypothetical protein
LQQAFMSAKTMTPIRAISKAVRLNRESHPSLSKK